MRPRLKLYTSPDRNVRSGTFKALKRTPSIYERRSATRNSECLHLFPILWFDSKASRRFYCPRLPGEDSTIVMSRQLFGTDGIRGVAGQYPLDAGTAHALGVALGRWAKGRHAARGADRHGHPRVGSLVGLQVAGGVAEAGVNPRFAGLITTPGVAYLTRTRDFVAGVMISASHNPYKTTALRSSTTRDTSFPMPRSSRWKNDLRSASRGGKYIPSRAGDRHGTGRCLRGFSGFHNGRSSGWNETCAGLRERRRF